MFASAIELCMVRAREHSMQENYRKKNNNRVNIDTLKYNV